MIANYEIYADDVRMTSSPRPPKQREVDLVAARATAQGWNGTTLSLYRDGRWLRELYPSERAWA